jgi:hypothetical protein
VAIASGRNRPNRGSITSPDPHSGYTWIKEMLL